MRTSVTSDTPSRNADTPAVTAPGVKATSCTSPRSPEAWIIRRTTDHSGGGKGCAPTSCSRMRTLSARISDGPIAVALRFTQRIPARRHHHGAEAARLGIADDDGGEHVHVRFAHAADGGDRDALPGAISVAHHPDGR